MINQVQKRATCRPERGRAGGGDERRAAGHGRRHSCSTRRPPCASRCSAKRPTLSGHDPERRGGFAPACASASAPTSRHVQLRVPADAEQDRLRPAEPRADVRLRNPARAAHRVLRLRDYDYTTWYTNIATLNVQWKASDSVSARNVTRWASYKRDMEASIGSLNTTTLTAARWTRGRLRPARRHAHAQQGAQHRRRGAHQRVRHDVESRDRLDQAHRHRRAGPGDGAPERTTYAFDGNPATAKIDRARSLPLSLPEHQRSAQLFEAAREPERLGRRRSRSTCRTCSSSRPDGRQCSASATTITTPRPTRPANGPAGTNVGPSPAATTWWTAGRPDLAADEPASYYACVEQRVQPLGRARGLRGDRHQPERTNQFLDPEETYNYEVGAQ